MAKDDDTNETTALLDSSGTGPPRTKKSVPLFFLCLTIVFIAALRIPFSDHSTTPTIFLPVSDTAASSVTTSTTDYGEVWLIRHGEKDPVPPVIDDDDDGTPRADEILAWLERPESNSVSPNTADRIHAMYDLNERGWERANHLAALVRSELWPRFGAFFASHEAPIEAIANSYPKIARNKDGLSMVAREFQTLIPMTAPMRNAPPIGIDHSHYKGETEKTGIALARKAVELARIAPGGADPDTLPRPRSPIVFVSWDHCTLPTLIVQGLGCIDTRCYRCWADDRFGDVLRLNVSLTTTITTVTATNVSKDYSVSSTILSMTGEDYPGDRYWYNSTATTNYDNSLDVPVSIEKSTACVPSYCTQRPSAKNLVTCLCHNNNDKDSSQDPWVPIPEGPDPKP